MADTVPPEFLGRAFALTNSGYALGAIFFAASAGARPFLAPCLEDRFGLGRAFIGRIRSGLALGPRRRAQPQAGLGFRPNPSLGHRLSITSPQKAR